MAQSARATLSQATAPAAVSRQTAPGAVIGEYVIDRLLGKGSTAEVYCAYDRELDRDVAIKIVSPERWTDPGIGERMANEARVNSALKHPGIVTVHRIGRHQGMPFIVMELVEGESLAARLAIGRLRIREALKLAGFIADALAAAHEAGIVHRDLKPQNIMLTADGRIKIVDFGLGRWHREVEDLSGDKTASMRLPLEGTIGYISPEQASGLPPDFRTDQFALGAILYEMVCGQRAFARKAGVQTLADIIDAEPMPLETLCPKAPMALIAIVNRCLEKDPRRRYESTRDLAYDLHAAAEAAARLQYSWRLLWVRARHVFRAWNVATWM